MLTLGEYRARLAEDCMALERALGEEAFAEVRQALADALMSQSIRYFAPKYDTALDVAIEDRPTPDRVRIQIAAKRGGYNRPRWSDTRNAY